METTLKMLKKVELATEGRTPSASKALVMKANVLFGISDNNGEHKKGKSAKMWTGGSVDGSTWRTGGGSTLIRCTIALFYTEHVSHHFELLGESRKKKLMRGKCGRKG